LKVVILPSGHFVILSEYKEYGVVEIVPYDDRWVAEFLAIGGALRRALGDPSAGSGQSLALRIDHIGSTSVPGLAAKDRIDVQIAVAGFERFDDMRARIEPLGYEPRPGFTSDHLPPGWVGPESEWEKRFFATPPDRRAANLHVRVLGRANQRYALLFRDYLRAHPASAAAYAELKRRLAQHLADLRFYADVKDPACDLIAVAAEDWARQVGWQPGPSDA
jgi:GrpB-like predicted nucleotidyltransferase (UPF0157 family)